MQLRIHGQGLTVDSTSREQVAHRLEFALGRLADRILQVEVYFADENGPRGGIDKRCRLVVSLPGRPPVVIEDRDGDLGALIDRSANRAGHTLRRLLDRRRVRACERN